MRFLYMAVCGLLAASSFLIPSPLAGEGWAGGDGAPSSSPPTPALPHKGGGSNTIQPRLRRPVALAPSHDGNYLYVANRDGASISIIDTRQQSHAGEVNIGRRLVDLAVAPDGRHLLAVDEAANALLLFSCRDANVQIIDALQVGRSPVSVRALPDGRRASVLLLWPRRVALVEWQPTPRIIKTIDLPFAPRLQLAIQDGNKLLVTDSFGGQLAVVDLEREVVDAVHSLPAHNIRGLAQSADGNHVLLAHQHLSSLARTTREDVHWGNLVTNQLRAVPLTSLLAPKGDALQGERVQFLGDVDRGAGDPAGLAVTRDGTTLVSLGGTGELAWQGKAEQSWRRIRIGKRPTAVVANADGSRAYVADTIADTVSIVNLAKGVVDKAVSLGPQPQLTLAEQGEELFYNARLSLENWLSCHSCHTDGHTNGRLNDNLGDGSFGAPKRVLSLLGVKDTGPWAWNGSMSTLESQIQKSVRTTMHGAELKPHQIEALAEYLRTLEPPPGLAKAREAKRDVASGRKVFDHQKCATCHVSPTYSSSKTYDVGLLDEVGNKLFNPPSLRGVSQGGPYFHDGRAATLEDVFGLHKHQLNGELTSQELADLLAFIRTL